MAPLIRQQSDVLMKNKIRLGIILVVGLIVRLALAWSSVEVADVANYRRVAEILRQGGRLYADTPGIYPYPPLWSVVESAALWLSQRGVATFAFWVELAPVLADMAIVFLIYASLRHRAELAVAAAALYALNPLPIMISSVHGQFDAIPIFFSLLAVYYFQRQFYLRSALVLMLAIAFKSFPVLLLPFFVMQLKDGRQRLMFGAVSLVPVLVLLAPFLCSDFTAVKRQLFSYGGTFDHGWLMVSRVMLLLPREMATALLAFSKFIFGAAYVALLGWTWRRRRTLDLLLAIALTFATFYTFFGGISSQYLIWILPFLILLDGRAAAGYSLAATMALLAFYNWLYPEMIYRAPLQILPETVALVLSVICTAAWWLWVVVWLTKQLLLARRAGDCRMLGFKVWRKV